MDRQLLAIERDRRAIESVAIRRVNYAMRAAKRYALQAVAAGHDFDRAADFARTAATDRIAPALMLARLRGMRRTQLEHARATGQTVTLGALNLARDDEDEKRERDAIVALLLLLGLSEPQRQRIAQDARKRAETVGRQMTRRLPEKLASVRVAQAADAVNETAALPAGYGIDVDLKPGVTMPPGMRQQVARVFVVTGLSDPNPWSVSNWIETGVVNEYERGRWDATRHPAVADALWGYRFDAVLDDRTSNICRSLHNLRMEKDDPEVRQWSPPLHFNCRSTLIPVWQSSEIKEPTPYTPALPDATWSRFENDVEKFRRYL